MPCTKDFTKETLLGRLESVEVNIRQSGDLAWVEIAFSTLNIWPNLTRSASICGDFGSGSRADEDKKIEEGISLLVRRQKDGKNFF